MSYCLNPDCLDPGRQKTPNPAQAKFCSNCGAKLLLSDRYRAQNAIGQGGFGRTFLGVDEHKPSKPYCVIKQSFIQNQTSWNLDKAASLFRQEAMRLEELGQHPQIPSLLAYFEYETRQYLIQEFVDGQNLAQQLHQSQPFEEAQLRQVLHDLLPVLTFIHAHQVIHRDIKPENIIRRKFDSQLVLVDFGAAKFATPSNLLRTGTRIGSRGYTAPEQAAGRATFSSDLYSLAATCVHLLTQKPPTVLFNRQIQTWIWRPYVKQSLSESLSRILDKMLEYKLQDRYKFAEEVLDDLERSASDISDRPTFVPLSIQRSTGDRPSSEPPDAQSSRSSDQWQCVKTIVGHAAWVRSVAVSPDGQVIASGSGDKTVKLWSVPEGNLLHTLAGHASWVRAVAIAPDGQTVASASNDRTIRLWDLQTGELQRVLEGHRDWVRAIAFSPDGDYVLSGSQDKTIRIWKRADGTLVKTLEGHEHWVLSLALSCDGKTLVSGSRDHTVRIWQMATGQCVRTLTDHTAEILSVAVHSQKPWLVSGSSDQTIRLWHLKTGERGKTLMGHESAVNSVAFSPDGATLATAGSDKKIRIWNLESYECQDLLSGHLGWVWAIALAAQKGSSPERQTLVSGSWDGAIKIWQRSLPSN